MAGIGPCISDPLGCPGQILGGAASDAASSGLKTLADGTFDFLGNVLKLLTTFWISTPPPDLTSAQSAVRVLQDDLRPIAMFALTIGMMLAAVKIMWTARTGTPGAIGEAFKGIALTVVVTGSGALVVSVLMSAFDQWANAILDQGLNGDGVGVGRHLTEFIAGGSQIGPLGSVLAIVVFGLAGLASLAQFALMLVRAPIVVLLCVAWPVAAAMAVTKEGGEAFRRISAWLFSWTVYKLVAAVVYATAFSMFGDSRDTLGTVEGGLLLVVAIFALPSLLRLITPAAHAIGSGGGQLMMAGASAGGQMLGAAMVLRAGQAAQTHQVGKPTPFSTGTLGAAQGAAPSAGGLSPAPPSTPAGGSAVRAGARGASAAAAAGGPAAAAGQAAQLAQQQATAAADGASDSATGEGDD